MAHAYRHEVEEAARLSAEALGRTRTTVGEEHPGYASALIEAARIETMLGNAEIHLRELASGKDLDDVVRGRFLSWTRD